MWNIALNTFREIIRSKYFSLVFLFGIVLFGGIFFFHELSLGQSEFIVLDFGLSFIEITGLFIILFLGNRMLSREFEEKTIYLTLSRPIYRGKIILGKFLGFSGIILLNIVIQSILLCILIGIFHVDISWIFPLAIIGICLKLLSILAIILALSIFLSGGIATFGTLAAYIIGHGGYALLEYAKRSDNGFFEHIASGILLIFPNLQALNIKNFIHIIKTPSFLDFGINIILAIIYIVIILFISQWAFHKKSFDSI